jgi:tRNA 2-selenouridine synthase
MTKTISIEVFFDLNIPLLDVRTPLEFAQGHVPGAFNLPIFSNEERVQVGTTYKQQSGRDLSGKHCL